jgi:hypothetical protein
MKPFDIFLSYKSEDSEWVERLKNDLQKRGVYVWLDKDQIRPGDIFAKALGKGLATSRTVGLVVTPASVSSGWVEEEYYRALSLTKKTGLQLIPILLKDAEMLEFSESRQCVDFRNAVDIEPMVERLIWPGITGKKIVFSAINSRGSFRWEALRDIIEKAGFAVHASDYVKTAVREIPQQLERSNHVVAVVDLFEDWLPGRAHNPDRRRPSVYAETILKLRETADEVVFILYQHPDAFSSVPHDLPNDLVERFQRYFTIPKEFPDPGITVKGKEALTRNFKDVLYRAERLLLRKWRQSEAA